MCMSFTEHVRAFGRDCDPEACVVRRLEGLLRRRMLQRNLLSSPPAYLGYDIPTWHADGAFDDIVVDCYLFAVARRIEGLRNRLRTQDNIDGFVARNVNNFLTERQRRRDPIGYAVFGNVEGAASDVFAEGRVSITGVEDGRLCGESVFHLDPTRPRENPCAPERLGEAVAEARDWSDALADLTSTTEGGRAWVATFLRQLGAAGVVCVRVADLVSAIASRARADWAVRHAAPGELSYEGEGGRSGVTRLVWPSEATELAEVLERLRRVVPGRIALEGQRRVRERLAMVFQQWLVMIEESGADKLDQAELAERLDMPETTLSDYLVRLRRILADFFPETRRGEASTG